MARNSEVKYFIAASLNKSEIGCHSGSEFLVQANEKYQIRAYELSTSDVGGFASVSDLLDQITTPFKTFMEGGAYDGIQVSQAVLDKQPNNPVAMGDREFTILVEQKTNGRIKVDVYANAQLGQERS